MPGFSCCQNSSPFSSIPAIYVSMTQTFRVFPPCFLSLYFYRTRVIPSGRFPLAPSSVHQTGRLSPWRGESAFISAIDKSWRYSCHFPASAVPSPRDRPDTSRAAALHCGARQTKIRCDGLDRRPAAAFCVGAILEIHVHCSRRDGSGQKNRSHSKAHPALLHCVRITGRGAPLNPRFPARPGRFHRILDRIWNRRPRSGNHIGCG